MRWDGMGWDGTSPFRRGEVLLVERLQHPVHLHQLGGRVRRNRCDRILETQETQFDKAKKEINNNAL